MSCFNDYYNMHYAMHNQNEGVRVGCNNELAELETEAASTP